MEFNASSAVQQVPTRRKFTAAALRLGRQEFAVLMTKKPLIDADGSTGVKLVFAICRLSGLGAGGEIQECFMFVTLGLLFVYLTSSFAGLH